MSPPHHTPSLANAGSNGNISAMRHIDLLWIWRRLPIIVRR